MRYVNGSCEKVEVMSGKEKVAWGNGGGKMCGMEGVRGKDGVVW